MRTGVHETERYRFVAELAKIEAAEAAKAKGDGATEVDGRAKAE